MTVLEIGSGGCNAALLAEMAGPAGRVVSMDIDPEVTDRARGLQPLPRALVAVLSSAGRPAL